MSLGQAIIVSIEESIVRCYKHGWKDQMKYWLKILDSQRTNILTAETVDGHASAQAIIRVCYKKYGDFEPRYQSCVKNYKPQLEALENKLKLAKKAKEKYLISQKINEVIKKLYGDTLYER